MGDKEKYFFKSDFHCEQTNLLLFKFGLSSVDEDLEYGSFSYIVAATYKAENIAALIDEDKRIDIEKLYDLIGTYSNSEKLMIRFALQCFNSSIDDVKLSDVMLSVDDENKKVIRNAIILRY